MDNQYTVVLDTNTLVSGVCFRNSFGSKTVDILSNDERYQLIASPETLSELYEVLSRPKFERFVDRQTLDNFYQDYVEKVSLVNTPGLLKACRDPKDDKFLELAVTAGADLIITRDDDLLVLDPFEGVRIYETQFFCEHVYF